MLGCNKKSSQEKWLRWNVRLGAQRSNLARPLCSAHTASYSIVFTCFLQLRPHFTGFIWSPDGMLLFSSLIYFHVGGESATRWGCCVKLIYTGIFVEHAGKCQKPMHFSSPNADTRTLMFILQKVFRVGAYFFFPHPLNVKCCSMLLFLTPVCVSAPQATTTDTAW